MVTGVSAPVVCTNRSATAAGWTGRALPAARGVAGRLERAQLHRVGRLDVQQRADRRQLALWPSRRHRKQRVGELRAARRDAGAPPIAAAADSA
ncbi:hypothetical protein IU13_16435 [Mycobacterium tuberculosis]|nr:hypothetical protein IU13_16435 [Mycobacterium tuberculosis]